MEKIILLRFGEIYLKGKNRFSSKKKVFPFPRNILLLPGPAIGTKLTGIDADRLDDPFKGLEFQR